MKEKPPRGKRANNAQNEWREENIKHDPVQIKTIFIVCLIRLEIRLDRYNQ